MLSDTYFIFTNEHTVTKYCTGVWTLQFLGHWYIDFFLLFFSPTDSLTGRKGYILILSNAHSSDFKGVKWAFKAKSIQPFRPAHVPVDFLFLFLLIFFSYLGNSSMLCLGNFRAFRLLWCVELLGVPGIGWVVVLCIPTCPAVFGYVFPERNVRNQLNFIG